MKVGIIGAGNIGGNLGRRFSAAGHDVRFGVRDPEKIKDLVAACGGRAEACDPAQAASGADVVVLAVPWAHAADALRAAGDLEGKVLVDATNPLKWEDGPVHAVDTSGAEHVASWAKGARVVKAWNTIGAEHILHPELSGAPPDLYVCTDDAAAREAVSSLGRDIGFRPVDLGPLRNARVAEHLAIAWIHLAMRAGLGRRISMKVVGAEG